MMQGTLRFARVWGIDVSVHGTWIVAVVLITWSLADSFFPLRYPGWASVTYWVVGALGAVLLFGSVLVHELAHSLVARRRGIPVAGITLFIFGGVSAIESDTEDASDEFVIAIVGPLTSLVLAGAFWGLTLLGGRAASPLDGLLSYLAFINIALALFNLLPGFPLDGGRVVRAILWGATNNFSRATTAASVLGQVVAFALIIWGVARLLSGDILGGVWIALVGWFLNSAAEATRRDAAARDALRGLKVQDLMDPSPHCLAPEYPVDRFVHDEVLGRGQRALSVCQEGRLLGIVSLSDLRRIQEDDWARTPVSQVMTRAPIFQVSPTTDVAVALRLLTEHDVHQLPVTEDGRLVGLLTRAHVLEHLHRPDYPRM